MQKERRPIFRTLLRSLRLRCPACGLSSIVERPFQIRHYCPSCDALFKREDGFFVGAIIVNVVTTELMILLVYFLYLIATGFQFSDQTVIYVLLAVALLFPILFYHHGWSFWLGGDYIIESLPKRTGREEQGPDLLPFNRDLAGPGTLRRKERP